MAPDYLMYDNYIRWALMGGIAAAVFALSTGLCSIPPLSYSYITIALFLLSGDKRRRWIRMLIRDIRVFFRLARIDRFLNTMTKNNTTIPSLFQKTAAKNPDKIMFYFENEFWTYRRVDEFSNQTANYFRKNGIKEGDTVALFMETRVEFVALWLGLLKIGARVSLINHHLTGNPLAHSLQAVPLRAIIYGPEVEPAVKEIQPLIANITLYVYGDDGVKSNNNKNVVDLKNELKTCGTTSVVVPNVKYADTAMYIFTSGTTGMPKAVVITHGRFLAMAAGGHIYMRMRSDDVIYVALPLYHSNGMIMAVGQSITNGCTIVLRKKFSVSSFWKDCIRYNCTVFIYIGELCRYLLAAPDTPDDRNHNIRLMYGNGLRPMIWEQFIQRFGVKDVAEFYGSSEGIGSLVNTEGKIGAVGHIPLLWPNLVPIYLIKVNENAEPERDSKGKCIRVTQPGVLGMHISKIIRQKVGQDFEGYADAESTSKKIIKDVFEAGDLYYVSGDIFVMDEEQFLYFQDRTGDTFRWRGENVSTTEVEQVISDITGLNDAAVYGVEVPGEEGKAGMAAILDENKSIDVNELGSAITRRLPKYARPVFLRFVKKIQLTETFKMKKKLLKDEGFNPRVVSDKLFYFNAQKDKYLELTVNDYEAIVNKKIKF